MKNQIFQMLALCAAFLSFGMILANGTNEENNVKEFNGDVYRVRCNEGVAFWMRNVGFISDKNKSNPLHFANETSLMLKRNNHIAESVDGKFKLLQNASARHCKVDELQDMLGFLEMLGGWKDAIKNVNSPSSAQDKNLLAKFDSILKKQIKSMLDTFVNPSKKIISQQDQAGANEKGETAPKFILDLFKAGIENKVNNDSTNITSEISKQISEKIQPKLSDTQNIIEQQVKAAVQDNMPGISEQITNAVKVKVETDKTSINTEIIKYIHEKVSNSDETAKIRLEMQKIVAQTVASASENLKQDISAAVENGILSVKSSVDEIFENSVTSKLQTLLNEVENHIKADSEMENQNTDNPSPQAVQIFNILTATVQALVKNNAKLNDGLGNNNQPSTNQANEPVADDHASKNEIQSEAASKENGEERTALVLSTCGVVLGICAVPISIMTALYILRRRNGQL